MRIEGTCEKMSRGSSYEGTFAHVGSLLILDTCKHCRTASSGNWWCSLLRKTMENAACGFSHFYILVGAWNEMFDLCKSLVFP